MSLLNFIGKISMIMFLSFIFVFVLTAKAFANPACAVCTIAVGASLTIARKLGVDDSVVGVWAGAFLALLGFWTVKWFDKKNWNFAGRDFLLVWGTIAMIGFMYVSQIVYTPKPLLYVFFLDPFLFSVILGSLALIWTSELYQWMKARNGGHAHFPFEKVAMPVFALGALSVYFYFYPICNKADDLFLI